MATKLSAVRKNLSWVVLIALLVPAVCAVLLTLVPWGPMFYLTNCLSLVGLCAIVYFLFKANKDKNHKLEVPIAFVLSVIVAAVVVLNFFFNSFFFWSSYAMFAILVCAIVGIFIEN